MLEFLIFGSSIVPTEMLWVFFFFAAKLQLSKNLLLLLDAFKSSKSQR